ncbi:MAG: hypothetical protein ACKVPY_11770, partial [Paracoccaceae bacterium]
MRPFLSLHRVLILAGVAARAAAATLGAQRLARPAEAEPTAEQVLKAFAAIAFGDEHAPEADPRLAKWLG